MDLPPFWTKQIIINDTGGSPEFILTFSFGCQELRWVNRLCFWLKSREHTKHLNILLECQRWKSINTSNIIFYEILTSPCGMFACVPTTEFSVKMFQGTRDTGLPPADHHACLLCAPHIAISCQKPHGILRRENTCSRVHCGYHSNKHVRKGGG